MRETIVLDPNEEVPDRFEFDLTPYIGPAGPDFGEAAVEAYFAAADLGQVPIAHTIPNRVVVFPLVLHGRTGRTFDELRSILQAKVGLWQREGGVIRRETSIGPVYADIAEARLKFGGSTQQAMQDVDVDAVLSLECIPDWYGGWVDLGVESGTGDVIQVLTPTRGDHPGRARIIVTDTSGVAQYGVLWGLRSRHYDASAAAALTYEAEALTPLDAATIVFEGGASGSGNVVKHGNLGMNWTPVLLTDLTGLLSDITGPLTHTGTYRVHARVRSTLTPRVRFAWDVGDLTSPIKNTPVTLPGSDVFYDLDLGEVRIDPAPVGTHRWRGMIQAAGANGGEDVAIDKLWLVPLDEFAGALRAPAVNDPGLVDYVARDEFQQSAGSLNSKTLPAGGTWTTSGSTGDFATSGSGVLQRTTTSDSSARVALAGSSVLAATATAVDLSASMEALSSQRGMIVRYVDSSNYVRVVCEDLTSFTRVRFLIVVSGSVVLDVTTATDRLPIDTPTTLSVLIDTSGNFYVWLFPAAAVAGPLVTIGQHADLVVGGPLEEGKAGIYDVNPSATASVRTYDNFAAWVPESDAVVHPNQTVEIRTDGVYRENPDGGGYGPVAWISGDLPRLPAPGLESREVELLVKTSRGDLDRLPDSSIEDTLDVQVLYRPSYLYVPDGGPGS